MHENLYVEYKNFHTKTCMFIAPDTQTVHTSLNYTCLGTCSWMRSERQEGACLFNDLRVRRIISAEHEITRSQCNARRIGDMWSDLAELQMRRAVLFRIFKIYGSGVCAPSD